MSIQGLAAAPAHTENRRAAVRQEASPCASFQDRLARTSAAVTDPAIHLRMPGENTVYSGARGGKNGTFQEICAEYTADSTPEDPVVRVTGTADSGPFDFTCHINDIDPSNASYAEMAALYGHLVRTGAYRSTLGGGVLPTGLESGDVTRRRDYLSAISRHQYDRHFGGVCRAQASELLALYQNYTAGPAGAAPAFCRAGTAAGETDSLADALDEARLLLFRRTREGREWKKEQEEWDRLMKGLDSWIDALRERSERERKEGGTVTAEGAEALAALYRGYIAAAVSAEVSDAQPEVSREDLLSALTSAQSALLERLKEDRAAEEEREEWADLLRRLDRWIEALRGEPEEPERAPRTEAAAVVRPEEYKA